MWTAGNLSGLPSISLTPCKPKHKTADDDIEVPPPASVVIPIVLNSTDVEDRIRGVEQQTLCIHTFTLEFLFWC
jgi:hypothetical protein